VCGDDLVGGKHVDGRAEWVEGKSNYESSTAKFEQMNSLR